VVSGNDRSGRAQTSCKVVCFNETKIAVLRSALPTQAALAARAARHKALGHPARLAVLAVLAEESSCVCDLANVLALPLSTLSQHLKTLRLAGLVEARPQGKLVFYSLAEGTLEELGMAMAAEQSA
jgi:DNA-binding transcriptional ArsR family regulator